MILSRRVIHVPCIPFIFHAQLAFGITALRRILCRGNGLRVLFRLGEIHGNINDSIWAVYGPLPVLLHTVSADIVRILTELIEKFGGCFRTFLILLPEIPYHLAWPRHQNTHELCVKQISRHDIIALYNITVICLIRQFCQDFFQIDLPGRSFGLLVIIQLKDLQILIDRVNLVLRFDQFFIEPILY